MAGVLRYAYVSAYVPSGPQQFYRYRSGSVPREQSKTDKKLSIEGKRLSITSTLSASSTSSTSNSYDRFKAESDHHCNCRTLYHGRHLWGRMPPSIKISGRR